MTTNPRRNAQLIVLCMGIVLLITAFNTEHVCKSRDNPCSIKEAVYPWNF